MTDKNRTYLAIDLKSYYASAECAARNLDPLTTNLVVADSSRTEKTICLAVSPSLKSYGIPGRARLFEVVQKVKEVNAARLQGKHDIHIVICILLCVHQGSQFLPQRMDRLLKLRCLHRIIFCKCLIEQLQECVHLPLIICRVFLQILKHLLYNFPCMPISRTPDTLPICRMRQMFPLCHIHRRPFRFAAILYCPALLLLCDLGFPV